MSEWKPIETAPKDGSRVLLYTGLGIIEGYYSNLFGVNDWFQNVIVADGFGGCSFCDDPTYWMPIPPTPNSQAKSQP